MKKIAIFIATTFGSGYFPVAPGTVGAFVAAVFLYVLPEFSWLTLTIAAILTFFIGVWAADVASRAWNDKDPGKVNWDEFVSMIIAVIAVPVSNPLLVYSVAFVFCRIYDVWKPFPAGWIDKNVPGGMGIMLDDVAAGIYTNLTLQIIFRVVF